METCWRDEREELNLRRKTHMAVMEKKSSKQIERQKKRYICLGKGKTK